MNLAMSSWSYYSHCNDHTNVGGSLMARQLPVDDDVFEALQQIAEPLVDDVNTVLRRLLGIPGSSSLPSRGSSEVMGMDMRVESPTLKVVPAGTSRSPRRRSERKKGTSRPRAARGSLLPEREYEEPLLRALVAHGGSAAASELIEDVGVALGNRLTVADHEVLHSGLTHWKNRVQFVRLKLVQANLVKKDSPRGVWEITQAGRGQSTAFKTMVSTMVKDDSQVRITAEPPWFSATRDALARLDDRAVPILSERVLSTDTSTPTLQDLGDRFEITREHVRQIESSAIKALQRDLKRSADFNEAVSQVRDLGPIFSKGDLQTALKLSLSRQLPLEVRLLLRLAGPYRVAGDTVTSPECNELLAKALQVLEKGPVPLAGTFGDP